MKDELIKMKEVIVIGGGPAGLMAAYTAAKKGHHVLLIEKNEKLGKKIYITGKGRCNFTNDCSVEDFMPNIVRGRKFLTGVLYAFPPEKTIKFFEENGLSIKIERGNRAFPTSDHASDVTKILEKACKGAGVCVKLGEKVTKIAPIMTDIIPMPGIDEHTTSNVIPMSGRVRVVTDKNVYACDELIIATGGVSYPTTGSTGDGYLFARENNVKVTDIKPSLCGINLAGDFFKELQGLALKNVTFSIKNQEKLVFEEFGEMLFTHFGVSGPIVLSASALINRLPFDRLMAFIDLKPALDAQTLDKRLLRDFEKFKNKQIANALIELLPQKMIGEVLRVACISAMKPINIITKEERARLLNAIKAFPLKIRSLRPIEEAIVTSGGVDLSEINPKTMQCKKNPNIRFCGEVLDVDAFTGGFNMQIAFATGYAAGNAID